MELHAVEVKSSRMATAGMDRSDLNGIFMVFPSLDARWSPTATAGANAQREKRCDVLVERHPVASGRLCVDSFGVELPALGLEGAQRSVAPGNNSIPSVLHQLQRVSVYVFRDADPYHQVREPTTSASWR
jgi:hypothetical protein